MAKELVKIGKGNKGKKFYYVPAVANGKGYLNLEKGDFATVRFDDTKEKLVIRCKVGEGFKYKIFPVEKWQDANDFARRANEQGEQSGKDLGANSPEEETVRRLWRRFVEEQEEQGIEVRSFVDVVSEAIERERRKDETPLFKDVAEEFIKVKEQDSETTRDHKGRVSRFLTLLSADLGHFQMGEITEERFFNALSKTAKSRDGVSPASPKTLNHWIDVVKEFFKWFYVRENKRRIRDARPILDNSLELIAKNKIRKTSSPRILKIEEARALMSFLSTVKRRNLNIIPLVAVQLFGGLRNAEALRLRWKDIREEDILLSARITKTSELRTTPISSNLRLWLNFFNSLTGKAPCPDAYIYEKGWETPLAELEKLSEEKRRDIEEAELKKRKSSSNKILHIAGKKLGFSKPENGFRHTAVSAMCKVYSYEKAADYCGHDIKTQGKFYRAAMTEQEAREYFSIEPPNVDGLGKTVVFDRSAKRSTKEISGELAEEKALDA